MSHDAVVTAATLFIVPSLADEQWGQYWDGGPEGATGSGGRS